MGTVVFDGKIKKTVMDQGERRPVISKIPICSDHLKSGIILVRTPNMSTRAEYQTM